MEQFSELWNQASEQFPVLLQASMTIAAAFSILVIGWIVAKWIRGRVNRIRLGKHEVDPTLRPVLASVVFYIVMAMTLYAFLIKLGVPPTSLLAVFGAAGLAIGLALKDTLSNIASGVMMLVLRPLAVGEFVDTGSTAGSVVEIGLFATTLKNPEGLFIFVPNSQVWTNRIQNFGRHKIRKAVIEIGVAYETDLKQAQTLLLETLQNTPELIPFTTDGVSQAPSAPEVYVMAFGDSAINLSCRCWLPADDWFRRTSDLRMDIKSALDKANIEIPFPQRVVTMKSD
ncbi:small conductance mechanosensitive channel [Litorimonas taeanensis]|uniref:Small-conductance mechanosensitive channel n=1 Tax=Litorimonas taeanensis TaxID=568099 RepID=A0A420WEN8_9PROT|nr:mechanosensitive ion channel domain-containing protein [Litorimonas taeanensis]RKQ69445.1 small conductance mechanosensitive channel [Litorimonas taeanensis]